MSPEPPPNSNSGRDIPARSGTSSEYPSPVTQYSHLWSLKTIHLDN